METASAWQSRLCSVTKLCAILVYGDGRMNASYRMSLPREWSSQRNIAIANDPSQTASPKSPASEVHPQTQPHRNQLAIPMFDIRGPLPPLPRRNFVLQRGRVVDARGRSPAMNIRHAQTNPVVGVGLPPPVSKKHNPLHVFAQKV